MILSIMKRALKTTQSKEERRKKQLQQSILRKRKILEEKLEKVEFLKEELFLIEHEYSVRIGSLLEKDNSLDLEIMRQKNLNDYVKKGFTMDEARKKNQDAFYNEFLENDEPLEEKFSLPQQKQVSPKTLKEIKTLWKKLIIKFHPDLVIDRKEKEKREEIMKKINNAYKSHDISALKSLETNLHVETFFETSIERLEIMLIEIENMIIRTDKEYKKLKESEWFSWRTRFKKAKTKKEDLFQDLEKNLIDNILQKMAILRKLKENTSAKATL